MQKMGGTASKGPAVPDACTQHNMTKPCYQKWTAAMQHIRDFGKQVIMDLTFQRENGEAERLEGIAVDPTNLGSMHRDIDSDRMEIIMLLVEEMVEAHRVRSEARKRKSTSAAAAETADARIAKLRSELAKAEADRESARMQTLGLTEPTE